MRKRLIQKKLLLPAAMLTLILVAVASALAQTEPQMTEPASGVQGCITSISGAVVLVEEDPAD